MHVGEIIRQLRHEKRMTLLELSQKSGVALATLSRMENGKMTGTLRSHMNISRALDTTLLELYKNLPEAKKTLEVQTRKSKAEVFVHDKRFATEMLVATTSNKKMTPTLIKISEGAATPAEQTASGVEKFVYVLTGKVEANIDEEKYNLTKGDTLYFDASLAHYYRNTGQGESSLLCIISPPIA